MLAVQFAIRPDLFVPSPLSTALVHIRRRLYKVSPLPPYNWFFQPTSSSAVNLVKSTSEARKYSYGLYLFLNTMIWTLIIGGRAPCILILDIKRRWVMSSTFWWLHRGGITICYPKYAAFLISLSSAPQL
jgi:hypothetical protein